MAKDDVAGEGYRLLPIGTVKRAGDELMNPISLDWSPVVGIGLEIMHGDFLVRRKIEDCVMISGANEKDPNGIEAHTEGAKLDHGKLRAGLVLRGFKNALVGVSKVGTFGAAKYSDNGWKSVANGYSRYEDALYRHLLADGVDEQSGLPHLYHAAWNILAMIELDELEQQKEEGDGAI